MMTLEQRLSTIVGLLPAQEQARFNAPLSAGESIDTRLTDAVRVLAKAEGLVCHTPAELARTAARLAAQRSIQLPPKSADDDSPAALAARFNSITDPRAQTEFWRSLTAEQRTAILSSK